MRWLVTAVAAAAMLAVGSVPALAGGVSASPAIIDETEVLRGSTIFRSVTLFNDTGAEIPFTFTIDGDAARWITIVDPEDRATEITEILDSEGTGAEALIRIDVPSDTPNGTYESSLVAELAPPENAAAVGVGLGIRIRILLEVSGDEVIAAELTDLSIRDTEVGIAATIRATIVNTGNVNVIPEFDIEIARGGDTVSKTTTGGQISYPGEQGVFELFWDTANADPGEYTARVSVRFDEIDLGTETLNFTVHPSGTLSRSAYLTSLDLDGESWAGGFTSFTATVENPGQADATAIVVGELIQDGAVVGTYESQPFLVKPLETLAIPLNVEVDQEGTYEFKVWVKSEGGDSKPMSVSFTTTARPGADPVDDSQSVVFPAAIAALFIAAVIGVSLLVRKNKGKGPGVPREFESVSDLETVAVTKDD